MYGLVYFLSATMERQSHSCVNVLAYSFTSEDYQIQTLTDVKHRKTESRGKGWTAHRGIYKSTEQNQTMSQSVA